MGLAGLLVVTTILRGKLLLGNVFRLSVAALSITVFCLLLLKFYVISRCHVLYLYNNCFVICILKSFWFSLRFVMCNLEPGVISQYFLLCI